jgi:hypothetical protein
MCNEVCVSCLSGLVARAEMALTTSSIPPNDFADPGIAQPESSVVLIAQKLTNAFNQMLHALRNDGGNAMLCSGEGASVSCPTRHRQSRRNGRKVTLPRHRPNRTETAPSRPPRGRISHIRWAEMPGRKSRPF